MSETLDNVLSRLQGVRGSAGSWQALCPAHKDTKPSLSVRQDKDGKILLKCHAGCETKDIVAALGLRLSDLFPEKQRTEQTHTGTKRVVEVYDYTDAGGKQLYQVLRYEPKDFRQRRPDGKGGWTWNLNGITPVLYRLPKVKEAVWEGRTLFVAEGEKDTHTLERLGLTATTNSGGAKKWHDRYAQDLRGASVVILPDSDFCGREHAESIARSLQGIAASVKIVELPGLPQKGDVSDWVKAGHTKEELLRLVDITPEWTPGTTPEADKPKAFPLTDLGNAERLIATHGQDLRYDVDAGRWLVWNSKLWRPDSTGHVQRLARQVVRSMYDMLKDAETEQERDALYSHIKKSESAPRLAAMVDLARHCEGVPVQSQDLDADSWLLNCQNGTIDLRKGMLRAHSRKDLLTKLAPVEHDASAGCPRWKQFLEEVFQEDAEVISFVKRLAGYALTGDTREECVFILVGKGQNGKTKLVESLRAVLGDYAQDMPITTFVERREGNTSDLAGLVGARMVTASEAEDTQSFNEPLIKRLSGGDPITCRPLYQKFFSYVPTFKVVFCTNETPRIKSQNTAMKRRVKLVPFRQRFYDREDGKQPVKDDRLLPKLLAERSGILNWLLEGCLEWQHSGLSAPPVVRQEVDKLFESQDPLAEFLESECEIRPGAIAEVGVLWRAYLTWCEDNGRTSAFRQTQWFSRSLAQRDGIEPGRGITGCRILTGIGLLTSFDENQGVFQNFPHEESTGGLLPDTPKHVKHVSNEAWESNASGELLAYGRAHGWPSFPIGPGRSIVAGEDAWRGFTAKASQEDLESALMKASEYQ